VGLDINYNELLVSILVSSVGFIAFVYGKRQARAPQMIAGLILMIFPYFVSNVLAIFGIGAAVMAVMWLAVRYGW
jgi:hypothetical protein